MKSLRSYRIFREKPIAKAVLLILALLICVTHFEAQQPVEEPSEPDSGMDVRNILESEISSHSLDALEEFLQNPAVNASTTSVYISDVVTGKVVVTHNADLPLMGASTMKLVTIGAMMHCLPMNYTFDTRVETAGRVTDGVLEGNLYIIGCGDPTLNTDRSPLSTDFVAEVVKALQKHGIKEIRGRILTDESIYPGPACPATWSSGDKARDYGAGAYGLNFQRNHAGSRSVNNPSARLVEALYSAVVKAGIQVGKIEYTGGGRRVIFTHKSPPLDEIMRGCMMRSDNLYAECLQRYVAISKGKTGSSENGADEVARLWSHNKAPMQGVKIMDGSGLSRSDRLTARFLAYVLRYNSQDPYFASFFPLAGAEGTLRHFLKGTRLETYVAMKTGSLNDVQAYAGYLLDDDYVPTHVIVVIGNSFRVSRQAYRKAVEKLLLSYL